MILQWGSSVDCLTLGSNKYCFKSPEACFHLLWAFDGDENQYITGVFLSGSVSKDIGCADLHKAALSQQNCF